LRGETQQLFDLFQDSPSLEDRLLGTGFLSPGRAREFGCTGFVGKASAQSYDLRRDSAYAPYDRLPIGTTVLQSGDVMARMQVRMREIEQSLEWMDRLLGQLRDGAIRHSLPEVGEEVQGIGLVEGWRGEVFVYVRLTADGRVARYFPRDPSWHSWPVLERIVLGNIVPDFPVCNKSVNGSYSGQDL